MHSSTASSSVDFLRLRQRGAVASGRAAFTLLEVLLTLALIGLLAGVLVGGSAQLMNDKPVSPDEVFWQAVQEARKAALRSEHEISLKFVDDKDKGKQFVVIDGAATVKELPVPSPGDLEVTFLGTQKGGQLIMVAGTVIETHPIPAVTFYPDGTCTAFRTQFLRNGAAHIQSIDPWTCAQVLTPQDSNAPGGAATP